MEAPFVFGKIAFDKDFTDRKTETSQLITNFKSLTNTIIISPRRLGKSSLVYKAAGMAAERSAKLRFCFLDLYNVRSEEEFFKLLAHQILAATNSKIDEIIDSAKKFMSKISPKITFSTGNDIKFNLSFNWKETQMLSNEILEMAEKIAIAKKIRLIICIDEFQNIADFSDSIPLQNKLRANWQLQKNVAYCLYGSKRHMLMNVFNSPAMPFYKFGDILFLQKISETDWIDFIVKRFSDTRKNISAENAKAIAIYTECHSYYAQQLAQQVWLRTKKNCNDKIVTESFDSLLLQMSFLFQNLTDELSNTQINFLEALTAGASNFSSRQILEEYKLGTSANISKIRNALMNREVIDNYNGTIELLDPLYKAWLKKYYFKDRN
jgi:hypothetical protein